MPSSLQEIRQFKQLDTVISPQLNGINKTLLKAFYNFYPATANMEGLLRWAKILQIDTTLNNTESSLKNAVIAKLQSRPPINLKSLKNIIESFMGVAVNIWVVGFVVYVRYRGDARLENLAAMATTVYETMPAHLLLDVAYQYLTWQELDEMAVTFSSLELLGLTMEEFERGEWIE